MTVVIVVSYTLVFLWHQENVQIRTRLEMAKIYPTLLCPGQYIVDDAAYTWTDQLVYSVPLLEVKENQQTKMNKTISFPN